MPGRKNAITIFNEAIKAVQPQQLLSKHLQLNGNSLRIGEQQQIDLRGEERIFVIGAGKASVAMADATEQILGKRIHKGLITTKHGHAKPLQIIKCLEAGHPIPDTHSYTAINATLDILEEVKENDIIICLLSGGASSLWADTPAALTTADVEQTFDLLLRSGATITENNIVRKHLSVIKGGQLLRFAPQGKWLTFILSDVPDNNLSTIASGITTGDTSTYADALAVLDKYKLRDAVPGRVYEYLMRGSKGLYPETIKRNDPILKRVTNTLIGNNRTALVAAAEKARSLGYHANIFTDKMEGDTVTFAKRLVTHSKQYADLLPACILAGGETTLQVSGKGKGGRNQHMALAALEEMKLRKDKESSSITFLSAGTDGTDGPTDAAGAIADIESISMSVQLRIDPMEYLHECDSYTFFQQTNGLLMTGPTHTNVMDMVIVLIE